ncbi:glyoxylate/hydroxypyruvate reductase A-like isoform X1 [Ornithodoros turicata]|uniref:glyoxylate/hydroxypyruvate reductase A-like isoform X1 n=1 Tax=Ornithodoros turicata TaxID=34597 RepID=UPI0031387F86
MFKIGLFRLHLHGLSRARPDQYFTSFCISHKLRSVAAQRLFVSTEISSRMTAPEIFVLSRIPYLAEDLRKELHGRANVVEIVAKFTVHDEEPQLKHQVTERLATTQILVTDVHILKDVLYKLPSMKWIQLTSAGVDSLLPHIDPSQPTPTYMITRASCFGILIAEYVIAGIINFERGLYRYFEYQQKKEWNDSMSTRFRTLPDLAVGILGAGVIGNEVATTLRQFGSNVYGLARRRRNVAEMSHSSFQHIFDSLHDLLKECDYIINVLPSTPETTGMLNGDVLEQCVKKPVFINIGRGTIINEESLINALRNKWISGAILDVHTVEPLPRESLLWTAPNVIITPHISGPSRSHEIVKSFMINFEHFMKNEELEHVFSFKTGY